MPLRSFQRGAAFAQDCLRATTVTEGQQSPGKHQSLGSTQWGAGAGAPGMLLAGELFLASIFGLCPCPKRQLCSSAHQIAALESKCSSSPSLPFFRCKFKSFWKKNQQTKATTEKQPKPNPCLQIGKWEGCPSVWVMHSWKVVGGQKWKLKWKWKCFNLRCKCSLQLV